VYKTGLPDYVVSDLRFLTRRAGYITIATAATNKSINGTLADSTDIGLVPGWNLVGYPSKTVRNASTAFASINGSITTVVAYDAAMQTFITYPGDLNLTVPNRGYWINATAASSWTVTP
jgi:hypothetical protein